MVRHVSELELNQEIADLGFLDEILNAPGNSLRAADDDRLRGVELFPVFHVAQKFSARFITLQIFSPCRRRDIGNAGTVSKLAAFAPQMAFQTILQKVPDSLLAFFARLLIRFGNIGRHQDAKPERVILVSMSFQHSSEFLLRSVSFAAMAARGKKITVTALGYRGHRRRAARTGNPHGGEGLLQWLGPEIDVAQRKIAALVREGAILRP